MNEVVLAVIGLVATIAVPFAIHRATHPKRRVSYFLEVRPQFPVPSPPGIPAGQPQSPPAGWPMLVTLQMWSSGRADVSSASFDDDRPIVFQFSSALVGEPRFPDEPTYLGGFELEEPNRLRFAPALIGGGRLFSADIVVPQPVNFLVRHPLIDVEVSESRIPVQNARTTRGIRRVANNGMFWGVVQLILGFLAMILYFPLYPVDTGWSTALVVLYTVLVFSGLATVVVTGLVRLIRWIVARNVQRRLSSSW